MLYVPQSIKKKKKKKFNENAATTVIFPGWKKRQIISPAILKGVAG